MPTQTLVLTAMTRSLTLNPARLPVSVLVSPRLSDATRLGEVPDWLTWTRRLADSGLELTFECGDRRVEAAIDRSDLRPALWEHLFEAATLVRPFSFDDYSERTVFSFPVRFALSAIKRIYQMAALELALPERRRFQRELGHRDRLTAALTGLQVGWNESRAAERRAAQRVAIARALVARGSRQVEPSWLSRDGLISPARMPAPGSADAEAFNRAVSEPFGVYHHMPQGTPLDPERPPDWENLLDFHQAIAALQNYPVLQRALGLVFDMDLPGDFVPASEGSELRTLVVSGITPGWSWDIAPWVPRLATAVVHGSTGQGQRAFFTAPASTIDATNELGVLGLLNLDAARFGLAQVDVDGAMHKAIMLSETLAGDPAQGPFAPPHPEVFDPSCTLAALRSGGLSLYSDGRAANLMQRFQDSKLFDQAIETGQQAKPFCAEDLVRGYRLDVWDSRSGSWHSLHRRNARYVFGSLSLASPDEEGLLKLTATRAAPDPARSEPADDLYLHESMARWAGWSLSVSMPGRHVSRFGDPDKALPSAGQESDFVENEPKTPFKMTPEYEIRRGSLPRLRFGTRYRVRARVVDLCGNSLRFDASTADTLSASLALPLDSEGLAYLRFEPVAAPLLVLRDARGVTLPGSELERIVIRTFNGGPYGDATAAERVANDRHVAPPRISVETGERLGMFDDHGGAIISTPEMWELIARRDKGEFRQTPEPVVVAGAEKVFPLEPDERIDRVPYLPDPMARGAAFRDLPGAPEGTVGSVSPGVGTAGSVVYRRLDDPNPRRGSATLVEFAGGADWQQRRPFRLALDDGTDAPLWDPIARLLTVFVPKGVTRIVAMSSFMTADDLKLMGVWEWLREYIELETATQPRQQTVEVGAEVDRIAHVLQRAVEGGHWMLTPPRLLTLVHAVQQPIGVPRFTALAVQHPPPAPGDAAALQTAPETGVTAPTELAPITAWRRLGSLDAYLLGGLLVHVASTARVDLTAEWEDPVDDPEVGPPGSLKQAEHVDEIPLDAAGSRFLTHSGPDQRQVGYCAEPQDTIAFVGKGDALGHLAEGVVSADTAAPRHHLNDTRHHMVRYRAVATSRYRDYFPPDLDFTRRSEEVTVNLPASARPAAPRVAYVIPAFGWQRQTATSLKRSVRLGGGLRIYLERPWFSSGEDELLGVTLWNPSNGGLDREAWKPFITQWGVDPIWETAPLWLTPGAHNFAGHSAARASLSLEEHTPLTGAGARGVVDVVGYPVSFDPDRDLWFADIVLNTWAPSYMPFVRLALARFQPHALPDAMLSRVVLADFVQLTPDRSALVSADSGHPRQLRVTVSGPAPRGPRPRVSAQPPDPVIASPTAVTVTVQQRDPAIQSDLAWTAVPESLAQVSVEASGPPPGRPDFMLWSGRVRFAEAPERGRFRLLIEEHEYISASYTDVIEDPNAPPIRRQPGRLIYAETIELDAALTLAPTAAAVGTGTETAAPPAWPVPSDAAYGPFAGPRPGLDALPELVRTFDVTTVDGYVKLAQALLNAAGATGPDLQPLAIDGNFGGNTAAALLGFQTSHLLPATAIVDPLTWFALATAAPFPQLEPGRGQPPMQGPQVALVQELLNLAGAFPQLPVSAAFDAGTRDALTSFQRERGLPESGVTDLASWLALGQLADEAAATGSMTLTFEYDTSWAEPLQFLARIDGEHPAPGSETIEWPAVGGAGYLVELHDAQGQAIYRRTLHDPFRLRLEAPAFEGSGFMSTSASARRGTLAIVLPILPRAARLVFICSPLDADRMSEPASVLAAFDLDTLS